MRESRLSGSVEGVMSDHDSYSDLRCLQSLFDANPENSIRQR
jgi:hypothetical protein